MQEIFIDFETYYDKAYSLTKMTTPEYICDPRFKVMGVSLAVNDGPSQWYEELPDLDYENSNVIAYNCYFDAMILTLHYGRKAKRYTCSAALARYWLPDQRSYALKAIAPALGLGHKLDALVEGSDVVNKELIEYANNDNDLNRAIYREIIPHIDEFEREVHSITLRWGVEPTLQGDIALFEQASELAITERAKLIDESGVAEDVLVSNKKFCEFVEQELAIEVARKGQLQTPCLAKGDPEFQAMITKHAGYKKIWDARLAAKSTINITRPQALANVCKLTPNNGLPMPLKWCGASTTRWSGSDGINVQNLPNGSVARTAIVAPPGHVIVVVDSSQIELRLNAWWSKEVEVLDMLDTGKCLYIAAAAKHYGKEYNDFTKKSPERKLGKAITLGSGYGMGWERFRDWCASGPLGMEPMLLTDDEAKKAIDGYREANASIVANWREHDKYIKMMYDIGRVKTKSGFFKTETTREPKKIGPIVIEHNAICLPNGLRMWYKNLEKKQVKLNGKDRDAWMYNTKDYIYGARLQENCIAKGTEILTNNGWKLIETVQPLDLVHDGVEFVSHGGLINKSVQPCTIIDGVFMTLDHEVLTNEGWKTASQNPKPYRPKIWHVDSTQPRTKRWKETLLAIPVRLWKSMRKNRNGSGQILPRRAHPKLWLHHKTTALQTKIARYVQAPNLWSLALNDRSLPITVTQSLEKLWSSWDKSVQRVGIFLYSILGRHGADIYAWAGPRPNRQQSRVLQRKLPLDPKTNKLHEQKNKSAHSRCTKISQRIRHFKINSVLPNPPQLAGRPVKHPTLTYKSVYDILNAGPRHRFVVRGSQGPFIVHNCVQGLARVVISDQLLMMEAEGIRTVSSTHDEILAVCPEQDADQILARMIEIMSTTPKWAILPDYPKLTLAAEGGYARNYSK